MTTLLIAAPILLSLTLLVSGLAKLGAREGTADAMTSLRLPLRPFHQSVATVLPIAEVVLALALWVPFTPLQVLVAVLIAALMLTYLAIIARAMTWDEVVECSCFGTLASPTVSRTTLARNILLSALSLLGVVAAASGLMARALVHQPLALIGIGAALVLAVLLAAFTIVGAVPSATASHAPATDDAGRDANEDLPEGNAAEDEELLEYERDPIPAGVLQQLDGSLITLRQLAGRQAALLLFVSEGCGPCERVLDRVPQWIEDLSPYLQVKVVLSRPLDQLRERTRDRVGEHALHDLQFSARDALGGSGAPSAVLLGADGMLAGGPVRGGSGVIEFVDEIWEQLQTAQAEGELSVAE
ncbi:MAG: MauE/DoxX family redox-associated membrane protein [Brachybacterium sp.]